ncbi:DNA methyltransferase [Scenedesmus sp. NREL 46B-D3]|nr:DNA methyltransferase [Scenedesmus sp. NREL 46B-D3]
MGHLTALEFYSGIGGMHCALKLAAPTASVLDAFDINHSANQCYKHNFGKAPKQVDIEHMKAAQLDVYAADLWLLAPPCQPFTRQGAQRGAQDNRSRSFLSLLEQIPAMSQPPSYLLLENVVGFETSDMHRLLQQCLAAAGYYVAEFVLSPLQYGIPYSRPRYFCLASKQALPAALPAAAQPCQCTPSLLLQLQQQQAGLQTLTAAAQQAMQSLSSHPQQVAAAVPDPLAGLWVPDEVLAKHAEVIDVVTGASCSCNCFTKAYGRLARGAGSLLAAGDPACSLAAAWRQLQPRHFAPAEIARMHSFPTSFTFPDAMTPRQCYKLLGNSLSVAVVADLLKYLLLSGSPAAGAAGA